MKKNLLASKVLIIAFFAFYSSTVSSQCTWRNVISDSYEYTTAIPHLIPGTVNHSTPQAFAVRTGTKSVYMNFLNTLPAGSLVYERQVTVCPNVAYDISAWLTTSFGGTQCNVKIEVVDALNNVLTLIDTMSPSYAPAWSNFSTGPITPTTSTVTFRLYSNIAGSQGGNDLSMDDFAVEQCSPLDLGPNLTICNTTTDTIDAGPGFTSYLWSNNSTSQQLVASTTLPGNTFNMFHVSATDSNGCTFRDTVIVNFVVCASVPGVEQNSGIHIYPNPASDIVNISSEQVISRITMYNVLGEKISEITSDGKVPVASFPRGIYLLRIETASGMNTVKIMLE